MCGAHLCLCVRVHACARVCACVYVGLIHVSVPVYVHTCTCMCVLPAFILSTITCYSVKMSVLVITKKVTNLSAPDQGPEQTLSAAWRRVR